MIGWEVRILADNEQQDDYLSNMLNALNEKEQESQSYNDPETIARQAKEKLEAENAVKEANEPEREADADAKLEALLDNTPLEEAAGAKLTSDDNSELSDDDMKRLMNMNLDDIIDDVKSDSASIDDLFGSSPDKETEHNGKSADTQAQTISADDKKKLKPQKEGFFKKIKKVFFDSLEDDTETAESASEAVGEKESIEENVVKDSSDKGKTSSGNEPKDENEQIIEDVFGNKSTLDESQVPKKGFFARLKYRLEQMKAKHIEEEKAAEEARQESLAAEEAAASRESDPQVTDAYGSVITMADAAGNTGASSEGKKEVSVSLDNQDITPYLIKSWIENDKNVGTHFLLTPPLFRLEGKQKNVVRIFKLDGQLPTDRESLFFFNTTSIPASSTEADRNTLQIAVRTKLKLIFRPKSLSDDVPVNHAKELSWSRSGNQVIVKNPSPFYINFMFIKVNGQSLIMKDKNFVAPFSSASYALPSTNGGKVEWKIINDMGGQSDLYQSSL